jgi:hypothetical protein
MVGRLHRFGDRFGIAVVVLVPFEKGLHVLRRDQPHLVTKSFELSAEMVRPGTGLHADQTARKVHQPALELCPRHFDCKTIAPR